MLEMAIDAWRGDEFKDYSPEDIEYNINYFTVGKQIIDKELSKGALNVS